jgi:hypothetical protein
MGEFVVSIDTTWSKGMQSEITVMKEIEDGRLIPCAQKGIYGTVSHSAVDLVTMQSLAVVYRLIEEDCVKHRVKIFDFTSLSCGDGDLIERNGSILLRDPATDGFANEESRL